MCIWHPIRLLVVPPEILTRLNVLCLSQVFPLKQPGRFCFQYSTNTNRTLFIQSKLGDGTHQYVIY